MPCSWKQIHRLHLLCVISILFQPCSISCGGGGVAADVDHPAGSHAHHGGKGSFVAALAGWIQHYDVRVKALSGKAGGGLTGICAEKSALCGHICTHAGSVSLGTFNGFRYDLHTDQLTAVCCHGKTNSAHAAVEVQQQVVRGKLSILGGNAVKLLSSKGIDLIEGKRAKLHRNTAQGVFNIPLPIQGVGLGAKNYVGVFSIYVQQDRGDLCKLSFQPGAKLFSGGQLGTGADKADHDLATVSAAPQKDMTHKAPAGLLAVRLDALFCKKSAQCVANLIQHTGLQAAVRAGDDTVGAPGVEADTGLAAFVHAHRELHLIAVAVHFRRTHNGQNRHIQSSDAGKGICNILLLGAQLGSIVQMPQAAAAAGACHGTIHRDTVRRRSEHLVQNTEGVALAVLNDAHPGFVAGGGTGNKHGLTVWAVCYAAAIAGKTLYAQGENLIFL